MTVTKASLIEEIAQYAGLSKNHAKTVVETFFDTMGDAFVRGDKIELRGFGTFGVRTRGARIGRNPRTGERVHVPPKRVPYFKPGKILKLRLNPGGKAPAPAEVSAPEKKNSE